MYLREVNIFNFLRPFIIQGIAVTAGFFFHLAVVRVLGSYEAGIFFASFSIYAIFSMTSLFGQQKGLISRRYFDNGGDFRWIFSYIILSWILVLFIWIIFFSEISFRYILNALFAAFVASIGIFYQSKRWFFISSIFQQYGINILAILFLIFFSSIQNADQLAKYFTISAIFLVLASLLFGKIPFKNITGEKENHFHQFGIGLVPFWLISVFSSSFDYLPIYISSIVTQPVFTASFAVIIKVVALCSFSLVAINRFSLVEYAKKSNDLDFLHRASRRYGFYAFIVSVPIFILLLSFPGKILLFFSQDFTGDANILRWCLIPHLFNLLTGQSTALLMVTGNVNIVLRNQIISAIVLLLFSLLAIYSGDIMFVILSFIIPPSLNNSLNFFSVYKILNILSFPKLIN